MYTSVDAIHPAKKWFDAGLFSITLTTDEVHTAKMPLLIQR